MTIHTSIRIRARRNTLGTFGLLLVRLVAGLAERAYDPGSGRAASLLARRGIDAIAAVGWMVDRVPARLFGRGAEVGVRRGAMATATSA